MVAPLSKGPPPETSRTGLPQVWPSRQEKVCTDMAPVITRRPAPVHLPCICADLERVAARAILLKDRPQRTRGNRTWRVAEGCSSWAEDWPLRDAAGHHRNIRTP